MYRHLEKFMPAVPYINQNIVGRLGKEISSAEISALQQRRRDVVVLVAALARAAREACHREG